MDFSSRSFTAKAAWVFVIGMGLLCLPILLALVDFDNFLTRLLKHKQQKEI